MRSIHSARVLAMSMGVLLIGSYADEAFSDNTLEPLPDIGEERLRQQASKIRIQYEGAETPDSVMFQSLVRRISERYVVDPERTIRKVRVNMKLDGDEEAVAFILVLQQEYKSLSSTKLKARKSILCNADPNRTREQLFGDVDATSDIELTLAASAHDEFIASLDPEYARKFSEWLDESKQGYHYYVFRAEASLESSTDDPITYYRDKCVQIESKLRTVQ